MLTLWWHHNKGDIGYSITLIIKSAFCTVCTVAKFVLELSVILAYVKQIQYKAACTCLLNKWEKFSTKLFAHFWDIVISCWAVFSCLTLYIHCNARCEVFEATGTNWRVAVTGGCTGSQLAWLMSQLTGCLFRPQHLSAICSKCRSMAHLQNRIFFCWRLFSRRKWQLMRLLMLRLESGRAPDISNCCGDIRLRRAY